MPLKRGASWKKKVYHFILLIHRSTADSHTSLIPTQQLNSWWVTHILERHGLLLRHYRKLTPKPESRFIIYFTQDWIMILHFAQKCETCTKWRREENLQTNNIQPSRYNQAAFNRWAIKITDNQDRKRIIKSALKRPLRLGGNSLCSSDFLKMPNINQPQVVRSRAHSIDPCFQGSLVRSGCSRCFQDAS